MAHTSSLLEIVRYIYIYIYVLACFTLSDYILCNLDPHATRYKYPCHRKPPVIIRVPPQISVNSAGTPIHSGYSCNYYIEM